MMFAALFLYVAMPNGLVRAQATPEPAADGERRDLTLLISIDGFKPAYLRRGSTPNLDALAQTGATADGLIPVFPTLTFPNHYSLVTGLHPDHHGVINNTMHDNDIRGPSFALSLAAALANPVWWNDAEPLWVSLERAGRPTASVAWPGTNVAIRGHKPTFVAKYQSLERPQESVERMLGFLGTQGRERPQFATLYFSAVDVAGHKYGPRSQEVRDAVAAVDAAIGQLIGGLGTLGLQASTNIIVVSDHGMVETVDPVTVDLRALLKDVEGTNLLWTGTLAGFDVGEANTDAALQAVGGDSRFTCWRKSQIPARLHFGSHRRVPAVVCLPQPGTLLGGNLALPNHLGNHGFDPADPDVWGVFIARGPLIAPQSLGLVRTIDVYAALCALLRHPCAANDGDDRLARALIR